MAARKPAEAAREERIEIEGVPTAYGLIKMGLAREVHVFGGGRRIHVSPEGHALMGAALRQNALEALAAGKGDWVQPPSRTDLGNQS